MKPGIVSCQKTSHPTCFPLSQYAGPDSYEHSIVEAYVGIICLCMPNVSKLVSQHLPALESLRSRWSSRWSSLRSKLAWKSTLSGSTKLTTDPSSPSALAQSQEKPGKPAKVDEDTWKTYVTGTTLVEMTQLSTVRSVVEAEKGERSEEQKDEALEEIIKSYARERSVDVESFPPERTWSV